MSVQMTEREQWAEVEARQFDLYAVALNQSADKWKSQEVSVHSLHMALVCQLKAEGWEAAAQSLRQPYLTRTQRDVMEARK